MLVLDVFNRSLSGLPAAAACSFFFASAALMFASASLFASAAAFAVSLFVASRAFFAASDCFTASDMTLSDARSDSAFLAAASLALASAFLFISASLCCFSEFCALSTAASLCFFKSAFALALYSASLLVSSALALMAASLFAASALAWCALFSTSILASLSFCNCDALEACAKELSVRAFSAAFLCASAALLCASACASFAFGVVVVGFETVAVFAGVVFETTAVDFFAVDTTADFVSAYTLSSPFPFVSSLSLFPTALSSPRSPRLSQLKKLGPSSYPRRRKLARFPKTWSCSSVFW